MATPAETPVTTPVPAPTVAMAVEPLLHVPPPGVLDKVIVDATQTVEGPVIGDGDGLMDTTLEE